MTIKGETPNFYPKPLDKFGEVISIGDTIYCEGDDTPAIVDGIHYRAGDGFNIFLRLMTGELCEMATPDAVSHTIEREDGEDEWPAKETLTRWYDLLGSAIKEMPIGDYPCKNKIHGVWCEISQILHEGSE
jgi:hypothetical protein